VPKITKILHRPSIEPEKEGRVWIYVDNEYCCSVRTRIFPAMNLHEGDEILSCENIKEREKFFWKKVYGPDSWEKEKVRIGRVKNIIEGIDPRVSVKITGFGADSTEFIAEHPPESGKPDLEIVSKQNIQLTLMQVEVTGTEMMRGTAAYWVRPDKLNYAINHPDEDIWVILHYAMPKERFVFIKPDLTKKYPRAEKRIHGATEHYVEFFDSSSEVVSQAEFTTHLKNKLDNIKSL